MRPTPTIWMGLCCVVLIISIPREALAQHRPHEAIGSKWTAIPLLNFSSDDGTGYGLRYTLFDYDGVTVPYRRAYSVQAFFTTGGKWVHRFFLDVPKLRPDQRLEIEALYEKEDFANYFGDLTDQQVDAYSKEQKTFKQVYPKLRLRWIRDLKLPWRLRLGLQAGHTGITANADTGNVLGDLDPLGAEGGGLVRAGAAVRFDTRDDYTNSTSGVLEELLVEYGIGGGGDYNGVRLGFQHRWFLPAGKDIIFAQRLTGDLIFGDLPFYEELDLGGSESVRGLPSARERDAGRVLLNSELRWRGIPIAARKGMYLGLTLFADAGQIFEGAQDFQMDDWRTSAGGGLRFCWHSTIVRADYGVSGDTTGIYITFSHLF